MFFVAMTTLRGPQLRLLRGGSPVTVETQPCVARYVHPTAEPGIFLVHNYYAAWPYIVVSVVTGTPPEAVPFRP
jgi:hypothetical protein